MDEQLANFQGKDKIFKDRDDVEVKALLDQGRVVELEGVWNGKKTLLVPRWSVRRFYSCGHWIALIIANLFPHDLFFLLQVDITKQATAAAQIWEILSRVYNEVAKVICITCNIKEEEAEEFFEAISQIDFLELFCTIIEQEINNQTVEAITKKFQRLLAERFQLENVLPDFGELSEEALKKSLTLLQSSNLQSSINIPPSKIKDASCTSSSPTQINKEDVK